jgi:hypothetical protein
MPALAIRDDIGSGELRRRPRRESDGRVSARLIAIAYALEGMDRATAARLAGMDRQTLRDLGSSLQCRRNCRAVQPASAGTQAEAKRRTDGGLESGRTGRSRSGGGQTRAVAHRRSVPVGRGALGRQLQRDRDAESVVLPRPPLVIRAVGRTEKSGLASESTLNFRPKFGMKPPPELQEIFRKKATAKLYMGGYAAPRLL